MVSACQRAAAVAIMLAFDACTAGTALASGPRLPATVKRHLQDIDYWCSRLGGMPPKSRRHLRVVELTGDGRPDYLVDLSRYSCRRAETFMDGGHNGSPVWIFVGARSHAARLAYDDYSHGVELASTSGKARVWLRVYGLTCGQPPGTAHSFAGSWFCSRPLKWNARKRKFVFAPLDQIKHLDKPRWPKSG